LLQLLIVKKRPRRPDEGLAARPDQPQTWFRRRNWFDIDFRGKEPSLTYKVTDSKGRDMRIYRSGPPFVVGQSERLNVADGNPPTDAERSD